jgi:hypothetical protein
LAVALLAVVLLAVEPAGRGVVAAGVVGAGVAVFRIRLCDESPQAARMRRRRRIKNNRILLEKSRSGLALVGLINTMPSLLS